ALAMIVVVARAICFQLGKLVFPYPLLLAYPRWDTGAAWQWLVPIALLAALTLLALKRDRVGRATVAAALAFVALLLPPVLLYDPRGAGFVADAQQYLARAPLLMLVAAALAPLVPDVDEEGRHRATRPLIALALAVALGTVTWLQAET